MEPTELTQEDIEEFLESRYYKVLMGTIDQSGAPITKKKQRFWYDVSYWTPDPALSTIDQKEEDGLD